MERFQVIVLANGRYGVVDTQVDRRVGFSYSNPPMYKDEEWGNYYAARGFAQKLEVKVRR